MTAVAIGAVSFLMAGCSDDSADVTGGLPTVSAVEVSPDEHTLFSLGDRFQLSATATDERGREISGVSFDWSTRDADVATVDADGEVTGVGVGSPSRQEPRETRL
jgi:uncharacterized protein YjdB